ncbi:response regulator [uncultured Ferrovibrio sp.]|jgi:DNA-binding response OmpR family regulator|uniref:response regulator transcription factor n=1 Tax=uncultured Ferrovibrio sp. TaxID=1576913 RepID=UPI00262F458C|nr:response regulator [uncultured Ferrovibrio sp.]
MARILLVDDEPLLRETLKTALHAAGYTVALAPNGDAALKLLATEAFDVIVTDVLMPETDGLEMIMRIRKQAKDVRIIAISGGGRTRNMDMLEFAKSFGADTVMAKPFLPKQLIETIKNLMGERI